MNSVLSKNKKCESKVVGYKPGALYSFEKVLPQSVTHMGKKNASTQTEFDIQDNADDSNISFFSSQDQEEIKSEWMMGVEYCHENSAEIFEYLDIEKQLREMSVLPSRNSVWIKGSEFHHLHGKREFDPLSLDMYPSFSNWGTDKSPFAHSISQLYYD